jgi:pilus assembly protein CpaE
MSSVPSYLNSKLERSLAEFVLETQEQSQTDPIPKITSAVDRHREGLSIIAQDARIGEIAAVTPERLPLLYEALKHNYQYVIVDGFRSFSDHAVTVMDLADQIILPITQDVPSIRSAKRALHLFERLGYPQSKLKFVLNRYHKKGMISLETIESVLGYDIEFFIPNHFQFVSQSISDGLMFKELNPIHKVTQAVFDMSLNLVGHSELIPKRKSFFQRLFGKS